MQSILVTTAPITGYIGADYYKSGAPFVGHQVDLRMNEEIKVGKLDLSASPKVIPNSILEGSNGWLNRGLVKQATRSTREVVEVEIDGEQQVIEQSTLSESNQSLDDSDLDQDDGVDQELAEQRKANKKS